MAREECVTPPMLEVREMPMDLRENMTPVEARARQRSGAFDAGHRRIEPLAVFIIPYRDTPGQQRAAQLRHWLSVIAPEIRRAFAAQRMCVRFVTAEDPYVPAGCKEWGEFDETRFNRGLCCNVGAARFPNASVYVFHDVDLLPNAGAIGLYAARARMLSRAAKPAAEHWGNLWCGPYTGHGYVGGVTALNWNAMLATGAWPSTLCGWGGEDDVLAARLRNARVPVHKPNRRLGMIYTNDVLAKKPKECQNLTKWEDTASAVDTWQDVRASFTRLVAHEARRADMLHLRIDRKAATEFVLRLRRLRHHLVCTSETEAAVAEFEQLVKRVRFAPALHA